MDAGNSSNLSEEEFLSEAFDAALEGLNSGSTEHFESLAVARPDLRQKLDEVLELARDVAVRAPEFLPSFPGYEVLRELGRGAMGSVFLAKQQALGGRIVALKVLPFQFTLSKEARRRFRSEANALAALNHPHIVPIFDLAEREGALGYAMEWIDGMSLSQLIASLRKRADAPSIEAARELLGTDAALAPDYASFICRLGISIAEALESVHEKGIFHRDVKPSNILLRKDGTALLSDFGLAHFPQSPLQTAPGAFLGTPAFAAPEQLRDERARVDRRTDVYSLGATLYQALSLHLPFRGGTPLAILKNAEEGGAKPLRQHWPKISVDLETVVAKAMDPEPQRRYPSAAALADDLERVLAGEPVHARPPSLFYRLRKLVARNLGISLLLGALFLSLSGFAAFMSWKSIELAEQTALAESRAEKAALEQRKAERTRDIFLQVLSYADPRETRGAELTVREALDASMTSLEESAGEDPEIVAAVHQTAGRVYRTLSSLEKSEKHLTLALKAHEECSGPESLETAEAKFDLAGVYLVTGKLAQAEPLFVESLATRKELLGESHPVVAQGLAGLGEYYVSTADARAEAVLLECLKIQRALLPKNAHPTAHTLELLAAAAQIRGDFAREEALFREALDIWRSRYDEGHPRMINVFSRLAGCLQRKKDFAGAAAYCRLSLEGTQKIFGPKHPRTAKLMLQLANIVVETGERDDAEGLYQKALKIYESLYGEDHPAVAAAAMGLGRFYLDKKSYEDSAKHYRRAVQIREGSYRAPNRELGSLLIQLGKALERSGAVEEAESAYRRSIQQFEQGAAPLEDEDAVAYGNLAMILKRRGEIEEARKLLQTALSRMEARGTKGGAAHAEIVLRMNRLGY